MIERIMIYTLLGSLFISALVLVAIVVIECVTVVITEWEASQIRRQRETEEERSKPLHDIP